MLLAGDARVLLHRPTRYLDPCPALCRRLIQTPIHSGLTALEDQQLGGLIMWVPGSLVYLGIALALLLRWIRASDATAISS